MAEKQCCKDGLAIYADAGEAPSPIIALRCIACNLSLAENGGFDLGIYGRLAKEAADAALAKAPGETTNAKDHDCRKIQRSAEEELDSYTTIIRVDVRKQAMEDAQDRASDELNIVGAWVKALYETFPPAERGGVLIRTF